MVWCMAKYQHKLLTAGKDKTIKVWDLDNLQRGCIKTIQGHTKTVGDLDIDNCKASLIINMLRGCIKTFQGHTITVGDLDIGSCKASVIICLLSRGLYQNYLMTHWYRR